MAKKMFVGNLSFQTTESDIRAAFEQYGAVESVAIITDRDTGRSKGFGFVEMSEEDANKAIAGLSGAGMLDVPFGFTAPGGKNAPGLATTAGVADGAAAG